MRAQAKLLRVIQDGEIRRLGENAVRKVDVQLVAATNRRLAAEATAGRFRQDLLFRLAVVCLQVPALRDRPSDVELPAAVRERPADAPPTLAEAREAFERGFVRAALRRNDGRPTVAARELGISRQGLAKLVKRLGIEGEVP